MGALINGERAATVTISVRVLSLGAGVQSTTLALMAAHGEIEPPDYAIFADTQWEPRAVYEHLDRLQSALPFPILRVSAGNLKADVEAKHTTKHGRFAQVPFFVRKLNGEMAIGRRQCTLHYKVSPIKREVRRLLGHNGKGRVRSLAEVWIGISLDEIHRMKDSGVKYITNRWPLIERRMTRGDCLEWLKRVGWTAPKSSCLGCPFHSDAQWRAIRDQSPDEWAETVRLDRLIREGARARGILGEQYMHRSGQPLDEVDLSTAEERGQLDLFANECEGMCGV